MLSTFGGGSVRGFGGGGAITSGSDWDYTFDPETMVDADWSPIYTNTSLTGTWIGLIVEPDGLRMHLLRYGGDELVTITSSTQNYWPTTNWSTDLVDTDWLPSVSGNLGNMGHASYWDDGGKVAITSIDGGDFRSINLTNDYNLKTVNSVDEQDVDMWPNHISGGGGGWMFLNNSGTKGFAKGYGASEDMHNHSWTNPGQANTGSWTSVSATTFFSIGGACMSPDYRYVYDVDYSSGHIARVDAGSGNSLFTASSVTVTKHTSTQMQHGSENLSSIGTLNVDWDNLTGLVGKRRVFVWASGQKSVFYADVAIPE